DRQLVRKMAQERVGKTEISLRILEVDRVDLVRHGRRSDLALADLLPKISERNIPPDVAVEVDDDRVHARKSVEQRRNAIVRLDLRSERVELEPELSDHALRQRLPVHARIGGQMRVVVADRAVDLSGYRHRRKYGRRALQTGNRVGDFLPERRRRSGLAMRPRKHRQLGVRASELTQVVAK